MLSCCSSKKAVAVAVQPSRTADNTAPEEAAPAQQEQEDHQTQQQQQQQQQEKEGNAKHAVEVKVSSPKLRHKLSPKPSPAPTRHHVVGEQFVGPHIKCRNQPYMNGPERAQVPDHLVSWEVEFPDYNPPDHTDDHVKANPEWADKEEDLPSIKFNEGPHRSFIGAYHVDSHTNLPRNPMGRTGMTGRGLLGRFGPNFAADPIVTRWKRDDDDVIQLDGQGRKILEMVCIKRKDTGEWAIPGGMVDRGEKVTSALRREFGEEALASHDITPEEREQVLDSIKDSFDHGIMVYEGYVDDPRNTDIAWLETTAVVFHDDDGTSFEQFDLKAGDDAGDVAWVSIEPKMQLYASHYSYVKLAYKIIAGQELES
ncbi:ADP-ribose pyrophosphatase [Salpingoeca rosetta]|uniref:ADP-ribose pyrophosphatase n=1 Tax=Salpingoeca rosetta (strain ATCC 50818 / BSB-021) TaxID=946362 RepID=F2U668_SALR5|nr:ADP-ribose pyrophosphatase [Salpingoeca rosetta]EGD83009.1 ADP-ribose pyrophosphatase [Salpingoeca rosetta]|eukprot:XP_004995373.1 ADP-ribose pyrophosphatase [Salpingoeca rosetta]